MVHTFQHHTQPHTLKHPCPALAPPGPTNHSGTHEELAEGPAGPPKDMATRLQEASAEARESVMWVKKQHRGRGGMRSCLVWVGAFRYRCNGAEARESVMPSCGLRSSTGRIGAGPVASVGVAPSAVRRRGGCLS